MSSEVVPTNLRIRIVGKKARQTLYTNKEYLGGLYHIDMGTPYDQYWYIIPNHQEIRTGTFQIQNTITHQNLHMRSSGSGDEGEVGASVPDISKDDQTIRLTLGKDENAELYRFDCPLGGRVFKFYCRSSWQPPTLGCISLTEEYDDQWFSFEYEPLEFVGVDYDVGQAVIRGNRPTTIFSQEQKNNTDITQEENFKTSRTTERQSTWEVSLGLELAPKESEVGIPLFAEGKVEASETLKAGYTTGKTVTTTDTWEITVTLKTDRGKTGRCTSTVVDSAIEVPCTTTYKSKKRESM